MAFPNLFVVGAMKAGTTALYSWLDSHPLIFMSPIKEPNFFCSDLWDLSTHIAAGTAARIDRGLAHGLHNALIRDEALYLRLFSESNASYRYSGESTPSYLRSRVAAEAIADRCPSAKILVILRDPIDRAWSHFIMERNEARVPESFERLMEDELQAGREGRLPAHGILESGLYHAGIARFMAHFERDRLLILDSADLRERPLLVRRLNDFLGFDRDLFPPEVDARNPALAPAFPRLNRVLAASGVKQLVRSIVPQRGIDSAKRIYYGRPQPVNQLSRDARAALIEFYRDDVVELKALLGPRTPAWAARYSN